MHTKAAVILSILAVALVWAASSSGQVQPFPGPGTGVVNVRGIVDIGDQSVVQSVQKGEWRVGVVNTPDVRVVNAPPVKASPYSFLRTNARYEVLWPGGEREIITVAQLGEGGWVRVNNSDRRRWVNLDEARAVDELP